MVNVVQINTYIESKISFRLHIGLHNIHNIFKTIETTWKSNIVSNDEYLDVTILSSICLHLLRHVKCRQIKTKKKTNISILTLTTVILIKLKHQTKLRSNALED